MIRRLILRTLALMLLLVAGIFTIPYIVPAEVLRDQANAIIAKLSPVPVTLDGRIRVHAWPSLAFEAEKVTVANPPGYLSPIMAELHNLRLEAEIMPLLRKQLHVQGISMKTANIYLQRRTDGQANWEIFGKKDTAKPAAKKSDQEDISNLGNVLRLDRWVIQEGRLTFQDDTKNKKETLDQIRLELHAPSFFQDAYIKFDFKWKGESVGFSLQTDSLAKIAAKEATPVRGRLSMGPSFITYRGRLTAKDNDYVLKGDVKVGLTELDRLVGGGPEKSKKPSALPVKDIALEGGLSIANQFKNIQLSDALLQVDDQKLHTNLAINLLGDVPSIGGKLTAKTLDLQRYANGKASADNKEPAKGSSGWSKSPIQLDALRAVNANLDLAFDTVKLSQGEIQQCAANVKLQGGKLTTTLAQATMFEGKGSGSLTVDGSGATPALGINMQVSGANIQSLLHTLSGVDKIAGQGNFTLQANGAGPHMDAIVRSLSGKGNLSVADGAILGINIAQSLRNITKPLAVKAKEDERTDFSELKGSYVIAGGVLSNQDFFMKAPLLRLDGKGTVDLGAQRMDYIMKPSLVASLEGQGGKDDLTGIKVPFAIKGPWSDLSIEPDLAGALKENLSDPSKLKDSAKALTKDAKEQVKDVKEQIKGVKDLFKGL